MTHLARPAGLLFASMLYLSVLPAALAVPHPARAASTPANKAALNTPLHFEPPAAGPAVRMPTAYEDCIDHPSPDGLAIDCQALLHATPGTKPRLRRH